MPSSRSVSRYSQLWFDQAYIHNHTTKSELGSSSSLSRCTIARGLQYRFYRRVPVTTFRMFVWKRALGLAAVSRRVASTRPIERVQTASWPTNHQGLSRFRPTEEHSFTQIGYYCFLIAKQSDIFLLQPWDVD